MNDERIREIDNRVRELDELLKRSRIVAGESDSEQGERQYWADRREERRLLLEERKRLAAN
jgi:hypothetical protein